MEEPILSRLDRLDNILRQLEDIRGSNRTPKSSCASTPSSGTLTSDGQESSSSVDFHSPNILEKRCRPIDDVIMEAERKGTLIERLVDVEDRVLKLCLKLEEELEEEKKKREGQTISSPIITEHNKGKKGGLKQFVRSCVKGKKHKNKD